MALLGLVLTLQTQPKTILVQPPRPRISRSDLRDPAVRAGQITALFLREWLEEEPDARLVDEEGSRAILESLQSPAIRPTPEHSLWKSVQAFSSVDAVVTWEWKPETLLLAIAQPTGTTQTNVPWPSSKATASALRSLAAALAATLALPLDRIPLGREIPEDDAELVDAVYLARRLRAEWVTNSGEAQLELLRPYLKRREPWTAAAILLAAATLSSDPRTPERPEQGVTMAQIALPTVLGTPYEPSAHGFVQANRFQRETVEAFLLEIVKTAARDPLDAAMDVQSKEERLQDDLAVTLAGARSRAQVAGAIRGLGAMASKSALSLLPTLARAERAEWRRAVGQACAMATNLDVRAILETLSSDPDDGVAFEAAYGLWRRAERPSRLVPLALAVFERETTNGRAAEILACEGDSSVLPALVRAMDAPSPRLRQMAAEGLIRRNQLPADRIESLLHDPDGSVVVALLSILPNDRLPALERSLSALANHPHERRAEAARRRLAILAPNEPYARARFELAVEHPYVRRQVLASLADDSSPEAMALLEEACRNSDAHTRVWALDRLRSRDAERAHTQALRRVSDPHRWVRLQAAAVLAEHARAEDAERLRQERDGESDPAVAHYLELALARAENRPPPPAPPAAHAVPTNRTVVFLCGAGDEARRPPFRDIISSPIQVDQAAREASAKGKIFLARANRTTPHPAHPLLNARWRDRFWLGLEEEFADLSILDGIVLGEESMYFRPYQQWDAGWRLFCREAGIDPERVNGDRARLSPEEHAAWWRWEQRVSSEGFNLITDWIRLRFGVLKPGIQVCTFIPDQNGPCEFDREWKFDIGAGYDYETNNRHRYAQIRRFKTVWPDRPVIWLVDATPRGLHQPLNYQFRPLTNPVPDPGSPLLADSLCAWMAGAHPGYFYARLALGRDMKPGKGASGVWLFLEQFYPGSATLARAVGHIFKGVAERYDSLEGLKALHNSPDAGLSAAGSAEPDPLLEGLMGEGKEDPIQRRVQREKEQLRQGLLLERHLACEWARILSDLPPPPVPDPILLVGDRRAETGALRLPNSFDLLAHVHAIAGQPLGRYRLIAIAQEQPAPVGLEARTNLLAWLRTTPGLLYIHGTLAAAEEGPPWPWVADFRTLPEGYEPLSPQARVLDGEGPRGRLLFWQAPSFQGGVLFDAGQTSTAVLREQINRLSETRGIGIRLGGPLGIEAAALNGLRAMVSCRRATEEEGELQGLDLASGRIRPRLPRNRCGAIVAEGFSGRHVAAGGGVAVVSDRPLRHVQFREEGLEVEWEGLLRAASIQGDVELAMEGGTPPPISGDRALSWLLESDEPGLLRVRAPGRMETLVNLRGRGRAVLRGKPAAADDRGSFR